MAFDPEAVRTLRAPVGQPFRITKLGHVVIRVSDLERSTRFYTQVLGFSVSDAYPEDVMPGGMVFLRCNGDHHCMALLPTPPGSDGRAADIDLHHIAFELPTLDDVFRARNHLRDHGATIDFEGRRRAGCQIAVEFRDPDGHRLEVYWNVDQVGSDGRSRPRAEWRECHSLEQALDTPPPGQDTTLHDPSLRE